MAAWCCAVVHLGARGLTVFAHIPSRYPGFVPLSKHMHFCRDRRYSDSKLMSGVNVQVNGCLSLCVGPVTSRWLVQAVPPHRLPQGSWNMLQEHLSQGYGRGGCMDGHRQHWTSAWSWMLFLCSLGTAAIFNNSLPASQMCCRFVGCAFWGGDVFCWIELRTVGKKEKKKKKKSGQMITFALLESVNPPGFQCSGGTKADKL